jgi:hypothetical protein
MLVKEIRKCLTLCFMCPCVIRYVVDVMRAGSTMHATFVNTAALSK